MKVDKITATTISNMTDYMSVIVKFKEIGIGCHYAIDHQDKFQSMVNISKNKSFNVYFAPDLWNIRNQMYYQKFFTTHDINLWTPSDIQMIDVPEFLAEIQFIKQDLLFKEREVKDATC